MPWRKIKKLLSRFQAGFMMGELQSSAIPNSVIPSNVKFLSYENMKKGVNCSLGAMQHPWVKGALVVTSKLCKEIMNLKQQVNKLEEENRILITTSEERDIITWVMGTPLSNCQVSGRCPGIVSPSHSYLYRFS